MTVVVTPAGKTSGIDVTNLTQTWNAAGTTFTAIKINVTDTASAAGSLLMDLQVAGSSKAKVSKDGTLTVANGVNGVGNGIFQSGTLTPSVGNVAGTTSLQLNDAANVIAQRSGTNAQTFRVFNTWTDAANNEWGGFDWATTSNVFRLRSVKNGTGTVRVIALDGFDKAGAAANTDIPAGTWALIHDTSGSTVKLCYNDAGTLKTVALT